MLQPLGRFLLRVFGWKLVGEPPPIDKYVLLAAPHTSNWDGIFLVMMNYACELECKWMVKDAALRFPFRRLVLKFGAVGIDRSQSTNVVDQMATHFANSDSFHLLVAPEGTRSKRDYWKSGFYHMARRADVPIVLTFLDYSRKLGGFGPTIYLTGDVEADMAKVAAFYERAWARYPEKYTDPVLRSEASETRVDSPLTDADAAE